MATLRSHIFIDQLQPQTMCYLGAWIKGSLPRTTIDFRASEDAGRGDEERRHEVSSTGLEDK